MVLKWLRRKKKRQQTLWIYCTGCKEDLCSNDSFVKDADYVYYKCTNCGLETKWDFDNYGPAVVQVK
jgi:predicted RNA-binding Zn-ribbon protein involved in translation (DUF1610 family)